jgi:DNA-binding NtrC family response regulator
MECFADTVVLFVDDESDVISSLRRFLRKEPYCKLFAESGEEALNILASQSVAILVSDLRMPEMDGLTLLNKVKVSYPETKRLILSATTDMEEIVDAIDSGDVFRFIQKPLEPEPFKQAIREAIEFYLLSKSDAEQTHQLEV